MKDDGATEVLGLNVHVQIYIRIRVGNVHVF